MAWNMSEIWTRVVEYPSTFLELLRPIPWIADDIMIETSLVERITHLVGLEPHGSVKLYKAIRDGGMSQQERLTISSPCE